MLTVLAAAPTSSALAQSAGDRQYADPLVTDGGGQSGQQSPSAQGGQGDDDASPSEPAPTPSPTPNDSSALAPSDAAITSEATLPHTGAEPLELAVAGLALAACGALGLALPRRARHARR